MDFQLSFPATKHASVSQECVHLPVRYGRRKKSFALKTDSNEVYLEIPKKMTLSQAEKLLKSNEAWFYRNYQKLQQSLKQETCYEAQRNRFPEFSANPLSLLNAQSSRGEPYDELIEIGQVELFGEIVSVYFSSTSKVESQNCLFNTCWDTRTQRQFAKFCQGLDMDSEARQRLVLWANSYLAKMAWQVSRFQNPDKLGWCFSIEGEGLKAFDFKPELDRKQEQKIWQWLFAWFAGNCYQAMMQQYLAKKLPAFAQKMQLDYRSVQVSNYKSRWGSCKSDGSLQFNWRILQADTEVIDYLIVHELAHLRYPDHSQDFWRLVTEFYPETPAAKAKIRQNGSRWIGFLNQVYR